jgi:cold-inducible RNA-binding protein
VTKIVIANLPFATTETEIEELVGQYGDITSVSIARDRETQQSRGFAFVEMPHDREGQHAIEQLHGCALGGRTLTVRVATPRRPVEQRA